MKTKTTVEADLYVCDLCERQIIIAGRNTLKNEKWVEFRPSTLPKDTIRHVCESCLYDIQVMKNKLSG